MTLLVAAALAGVSASAQAAAPYRGGVISTQHALASEAALKMLEKGGNTIDAAVAAAFALAVVGPYHSGIGGGGFALVYTSKEAKASVLDFREVAPRRATREMYLKGGEVVPGLSTDGALSVAVPGAVRGYLELLEKHGRLPRRTVLAPAIQYARQGFPVTPKYQSLAQVRLECLRKDSEASRIFLRPSESGALDVPKAGTVLAQPELARTLEAIARQGARAFYAGKVARAIEETVRQGGGILDAEDLAAYKTRTREPLETRYRGHRILTMPPPSAGGLAVVQVLGMLERLLPGGMTREPSAVHLYAEAVRRVYVDRAKHLGDPAFSSIPLEKLTSADYLQAQAESIDRAKATKSSSLLKAATPSEAKNTTHISVIDKDGNAVAMTTTINYAFGSCVVAKGTGVLLNDEMDDFAAKPLVPNVYGLVTGEANAIAPGKIPLSSMSPTLVFQKDAPNEVMLAVGSPGGSTIPTTVIQVVLNVIDGKMELTRAVTQGRVHHQYMPDAIAHERGALEPATEAALRAMGHTLNVVPQLGDAQAVYVDPATRLRYAAADPRSEGAGMGQR